MLHGLRHQYFKVPVLGPVDAKIVRVWHQPDLMSFAILLEHESFEPVPDYCEPPSIGWTPGECNEVVEIVRFKKQ